MSTRKGQPSSSRNLKATGDSQGKVKTMFRLLRGQHPDASCELVYHTPFQLLVATVLSAQTKDASVNKITPRLFSLYPDPYSMTKASPETIESLIKTIGMYKQKAKRICALSEILLEKYGGAVPSTLDELVSLPGVGRKTANVVLGVAYNKIEGVVVDTHVSRLSQRMGWTKKSDPISIENDLMSLLPKKDWDTVGHTLVFHGRRVCTAISPRCETCSVSTFCPSAFQGKLVGRKKGRSAKDKRTIKTSQTSDVGA